MSDQDHLDLTGLLRGELSNDDVLDAGEHLDTCEACREELADLVVGHAVLSRASRLGHPLGVAPGPSSPATPAPPATVVAPGRSGRRSRSFLALTAAAAVVVAAGAVAVLDRGGSDPAPEAAPPTKVAQLLAVDGDGGGSVRMTEHGAEVAMSVETHDLPRAGSGHFYYLWLLDPKTQKMLPLGVIGPGGKASFDLPRSLIGKYQSIDVSLESDDGDPGHSVTSVLRGSYA